MFMLERHAAVIDEHVLMLVVAAFGGVVGYVAVFPFVFRLFAFGSAVQRHQRRHLHHFVARIGLFFGFLFPLGLAVVSSGACDLETLDLVFLAAAGFGLLLGKQRLPVCNRNLVIVGMD